MTDDPRKLEQHTAGSSSSQVPDDVISLKPLFRFLASYRQVIGLAVAAAVGLSIVVLLGLMLVLPQERTASVHVRLLFDGAANGRYPNGTTFSPAEIVATPVLTEVYRTNDLQQFSEYEDFKGSMTVLQASLEQDLLTAAYSARLADSKLTPTDRARLEDEFRKKLDAIKDPVYAVSMRRSERVTAMPEALMEKVLNDTLAIWAQQAKDLKGAMRFDVPVISHDLLSPAALDRDFLIAADDLRLQARRALDITGQLLELPGAATLRSQELNLSLSDVRFALDDTLRMEIEPLVYQIQQQGLASDPVGMRQYLRGRAAELRLQRDATRQRIQSLEDALQSYIGARKARVQEGTGGVGAAGRQQGLESQTLIPQLSDTFLDRVIEMSTQTQAADVAYRQDLSDQLIKEGMALSELERSAAFYEELDKSVRVGGGAVPAAQAAALKQRLQAAYDSVGSSIDRLVALYDEFSEQRLDPAASLYTVTKPFAVNTEHAITGRTAGLTLALAVLLALMLAPIGCAYHRSRVRRTA